MLPIQNHLIFVLRAGNTHIVQKFKTYHTKKEYNTKSLSLTPPLHPPMGVKQTPLKYNGGTYTPNCFPWDPGVLTLFITPEITFSFWIEIIAKFAKQKTSGWQDTQTWMPKRRPSGMLKQSMTKGHCEDTMKWNKNISKSWPAHDRKSAAMEQRTGLQVSAPGSQISHWRATAQTRLTN